MLKQALKTVNCNKKLKLQRVQQVLGGDSTTMSPRQYILDFFSSGRLAYGKGRNVTPKIYYIKGKQLAKLNIRHKYKINWGYLDIRP